MAEKVDKKKMQVDVKVNYQMGEQKWITPQGKEVSYPVVQSSSLIGLKRPGGNNRYVGPDEGISTGELIKMWQQNVQVGNGPEPRKVIEKLLLTIASDVKEAKSDTELIKALGELARSNSQKSETEFVTPREIIDSMPSQEKLRGKFVSGLSKKSEGVDLDKEIKGIIIESDLFQKQLLNKISVNLNRAYNDAKDQIFAELGDMNSRASEEIAKARERQEATEKKYVGYNNPNYDDEYEIRMTEKFERLYAKEARGKKSLSDWASERRKTTSILPDTADFGTENIAGNLKNVVRFLTQGQVLNANIPDFRTRLSEEMQPVFDDLVDLSSFIRSSDLSEYFSFGEISAERKTELAAKFPDMLENLSKKLIEYADQDSLDPRVRSQLVARISEINSILGTLDKVREMEGMQDAIFSKYVTDTFFNQTKVHVPFNGRKEYEGDAKRSILAKQGIKQPGAYPTAKVPQYLRNALPFFKNPEERSDSYVLNPDMENFYRILDRAIGARGEIEGKLEAGQSISEEDRIQLERFLEDLTSYYNGMEGENQKSAFKQLTEYGYALKANGDVASLRDFEETDFLDLIKKEKEEVKDSSPEKIKEAMLNIKKIFSQMIESRRGKKDDVSFLLEEANQWQWILDNFKGADWTEEELLDFDELDLLNLDEIKWDKKVKSEKAVSSSSISSRIQELLQEAVEEDYSNATEEVQTALAEMEEALIQQSLLPYIEQYSSAKSGSEKAKITKSITQKFGKDSKEAKYWKSQKENLMELVLAKQEEQAEKENEELLATDKGKTKALQDMLASGGELKSRGKIKKQYQKGGKVYSGLGIEVGDQTFFLSEIKKGYKNLSEELKEKILQQLKDVYKVLDESGKDDFIRSLGTPFTDKKTGVSYNEMGIGFFKNNKEDEEIQKRIAKIKKESEKEVKSTSQDAQKAKETADAIEAENKKLKENHSAAQQHIEDVEGMSEAEQGKIIVSKKLVDQLEKENDTAKAVEENPSWGRLTGEIKGFIPKYVGGDVHQYYDDNDNPIYSSTQLRDPLLGKGNPAFARDLSRIKAKALKEVPTAENMGMQEKDLQFMTGVITSGIRGDLFHGLIDKITQLEEETQKSIVGLENLKELAPETWEAYTKERENAISELKKYGVGEEYLGIEGRLSSYMDAWRKSGMKMTDFSEMQLGLTLQGTRGDISIGVTPDQLFALPEEGGSRGVLMDSKTGRVEGYEAFQLSLQKLALLANLDNKVATKRDKEGNVLEEKTVRELTGDIDFSKELKLVIADISEGMTIYKEYMALTAEEVYNLAKDATKIIENGEPPLPKSEVTRRMNRQLKTGQIVGKPDLGVVESADATLGGGHLYSSPRAEKGAIREYINSYKKITKIEREINQLEEELKKAVDNNGADSEDIHARLAARKQALIDYKENAPEFKQESDGSARIGDLLLSEDGLKELEKQRIEADDLNAIKKEDADAKTNSKERASRHKENLSYIEKYLALQKELLEVQNEEYKLELKIQALEAKGDKSSPDRTQAEENKKANEELRKSLEKEIGEYGYKANYGRFSGKGVVLSEDENSELQDRLVFAQKEADKKKRKITQSSAESLVKIEQNLSQRLLKAVRDRNEANLNIEKQKTAALKDANLENASTISALEDKAKSAEKEIVSLNEEAEKLGITLTSQSYGIEQSNLGFKADVEKEKASRGRQSANSSEKERVKQSKQVSNEYIKNLEQQGLIEVKIAKLQKDMVNQSGDKLKDSKAYLTLLNEQQASLRANLPILDLQEKTLNGIQLTDEQILDLRQRQTQVESQSALKMSKMEAEYKPQVSLLDQLIGGFKQTFENVTMYSMASRVFQELEQGVRQLFESVRELDAALVDIQIASGMTREETHLMMLEYNKLGNELGKTTQEIAMASNDWLRAGYQGQEAMELTRASAQLATLGMIDTADATSYLISTMKGWKMEAEDVSRVVDKLTAVDIQTYLFMET